MSRLIERALSIPTVIGAITCLTLSSCNHDPITGTQEITYEQAVMKATATCQILDNFSRAPLPGVAVALLGQSPVISDTNGLVEFKDLPAGDHTLLLKKTGYEPIYAQVSMVSDSNSKEIPILRQSNDQFTMVKKGVTLRGRVYYIDSLKVKQPAAGVKLELKLSSNSTISSFVSPLCTLTTTSTGSYTLEQLPEFTNFSLMVNPLRVDGTIYRATATTVSNNRRAGDTLAVSYIALTKSIEEELILLSENSASLLLTTPLKLSFSDSIQSSSIHPDSVWVTYNNTRLLCTVTATGTLISLTPFEGTWAPNILYTAHIKGIKSVKGTVFNSGIEYTVTFRIVAAGALGDVTGLKYWASNSIYDTIKANYNTTYVTLDWQNLVNASSYDVYLRTASDSTYVSATISTDSNTAITIPTGALASGKSVKVMVIGKNLTTMSNPASATVLTIRDQVRPYYNGQAVATVYGTNNTASTLMDTVSILTSAFAEPMDTTIQPILSAKEGYTPTNMVGDSAFVVSTLNWKWRNTTVGILTAIIPARANASYDTILVNMNSFKDAAGNALDSSASYTNLIKFVTRP